jgi:drug/metabolite transporter (DMT)-like permease
MAAKALAWAKTGWAALLLLCFLLAVGAMRSDLFPVSAANSVPQLEREAVPFALLALAAGLYAAARKAPWPRGRQLQSSIVIGLGLFVVPSLLVSLAHGWVSAFTRVALFSLVPVFAVVFEPYIGRRAGSQIRGGLLAALAAVVGSLCVFPLDLPGSIEASAAFAAVIVAAACVAAANCYAVRVANALPSNGLASMTAMAAASAAVGLVAASAATEGLVFRWSVVSSDLAWSAIVSLPGLFLLFWLMPRMAASRMTTRFVLAPLMAILISMALDRPSVGLLTWAGLLLIAAGAAWLLSAPDDHADADSSTLKLNRS